MDWLQPVRDDPLTWLRDHPNPSVVYLTRTLLLDLAPDSHEGLQLQQRVLEGPQARAILDAQYPEGYWMAPGIGYSPKFKASVWQLIFLAQLGAPHCPPVEAACEWLFRDNQGPDGSFLASKNPRDDIVCLNGNVLFALAGLGYARDPRTIRAAAWLVARVRDRGFACRQNDCLPCAWAAAKALKGLMALAPDARPIGAPAAVDAMAGFLLDHDVLSADFPSRGTPSERWTRPGFPLGYHSDALEAATLLAQAGRASHSRVREVREWVVGRQGEDGRWVLEYALNNTWAHFGAVGAPSPWVTLRALRLLKLTAGVGTA